MAVFEFISSQTMFWEPGTKGMGGPIYLFGRRFFQAKAQRSGANDGDAYGWCYHVGRHCGYLRCVRALGEKLDFGLHNGCVTCRYILGGICWDIS